MSAEILQLNPDHVGEAFKVEPDAVLSAAVGKLDIAVVVGIDADGDLYVAGSQGAETTHFLMARAMKHLVDNEVYR